MAKERSAEKKEKKEKRASESNGVTKTKKEKKSKKAADVDASEMDVDTDADVDADESVVANGAETKGIVKLAPFAVPMADDKIEKKVMKGVKRSAKNKAIRRGVKEVVKAIRKATTKGKDLGLVVLAADISPWDVLSHIPVLCEDKDVKYVWVPSRAELGAAGSTKRPTSVVMVCPKGSGKDEGEWAEQYEELWKVVNKASKSVSI